MDAAFILPASASRAGFFGAHISETVAPATRPAAGPASTGVTMRCRRDLKHEKRCRNAVFARSHRKKIVRVNRRAVQAEAADTDNEFLSHLFCTMTFGSRADSKDGGKSK